MKITKKTKDRINNLIQRSRDEDLIIIVFNDTETTGTAYDDRLIQSAHSAFLIDRNFTKDLEFSHYVEENVKAPLPIKPESAEVHGLWGDEVYGDSIDIWENTLSSYELRELSEYENSYYCAHNAQFDIAMLRKEGIYFNPLKVIDTLMIARFAFKNETDIKFKRLQYMRYLFDFDKNKDFHELIAQHKVKRLVAHSALSDIIVLIYLFKVLIKSGRLVNIDQAILLSCKPFLNETVTFGNKFEKGSSLYNAICSRYPDGLSYFNWAMINMTNLSIMDKMSISYLTIMAFKDKAIGIDRINLATPMIYVCAAFIPETWDYISSIGYDTNNLRKNSLNKIEYKIAELENSINPEDKTSGFEKRKELNFLINYSTLFPNDKFSES